MPTPPRPLQPYACHPDESRGRLIVEPESPTRSVFQRDRDRIIHSTAFRRLKYKTQVFVYHEGDHYRTRLTHTLEVAQIARSVARALGLNEDMAEAVALAHDLGHPPFGHAGEQALDAAMAPFGGFDHNEQTFRVLTLLERHYASFDGLNLTWECLEGVVKHNGPLLPRATGAPPLPATIADYSSRLCDLELTDWSSAEAQVAALADDIAYNNHDIDDGLRAGLFTVDEVSEVTLVGPVFATVRSLYPDIELARLVHESVRRLIDLMVTDLLDETRRRLAAAAPRSVADLRRLDRPVVAFSPAMRENDRALKDFLFRHMYRHERVNRMTETARQVVRDLFDRYMAQPDFLPEDWRAKGVQAVPTELARLVGDYIAGMTDRFALKEHDRLCGKGGAA